MTSVAATQGASYANQSFGTKLWFYTTELFSGVSSGLGSIHKTSQVFSDFLKGLSNIARTVGFFYKELSWAGKVDRMSGSTGNMVDFFNFFSDLYFFVGGEVKKASAATIVMMSSFLAADVIGSFVCLGELGFYNLANIAEKIGTTNTFLGKAFTCITSSSFLAGVTAVGFTAMGVNAAINLHKAKNVEQKVYHSLVLVRSITEVAARILFISAVAAGVAVSSLYIAIPLTVLTALAMTLSITSFLYKNGNGIKKQIEA